MEITSACLDFPRVSKITTALISSIYPNTGTSRKAEIALQHILKAAAQPDKPVGISKGANTNHKINPHL